MNTYPTLSDYVKICEVTENDGVQICNTILTKR
jgi:hypothetical protein